MSDPEAELQATANLSPVSPAPVHTAAPRVVPALQQTVDTLDAMVAAAAAAASAAESVSTSPVMTDVAASAVGNDHAVDEDSLADALYDDHDGLTADIEPTSHHQPEPLSSNDDYAKTFDSPIDPDEEVEGSHPTPQQQQNVSSSLMPTDITGTSLPLNALNTGGALDAVPDNAAPDVVATQPAPQAVDPSAAHAEAAASLSEPWQPPDGLRHQIVASPSVAQPEPVADQGSPGSESQGSSLDIQKLVADLTAPPAEPSSVAESSSLAAMTEEPANAPSQSSPSTLVSSSSLPPRPPLPQSGATSYASQLHAAGINQGVHAPGTGADLPAHSAFSGRTAGSAPGTLIDAPGSLSFATAVGLSAPPGASISQPSHMASDSLHGGEPNANYQRQWEQFMSDERQYMSDAKWDRFPEGSRIFIGNLSSDKVSKRDVFDVFHKYGRLAQISLKSAYGFVQYHDVEEGRRAMENLQGIEIKGRRVHLEISRVQEKGKKDRGRSPDRGRAGRDGSGGGGGGGRRSDKNHQGRDDYRPGRNQSPRRNDHHGRDGGFGRNRGHDSGRGGRGRSRSPEHGRRDRDSYRRRSPSPYGQSRHEPEVDLPRRYGADVPDVQFILQPDVNRDFATWVEGAFKAKGLRTEVMYLHPRVPKEQVIQRQAAEGVYGVIDLDTRAQSAGRIPVQAFDRCAGGNSVRFDQYVDLDPGTAAEVIVRAKATAAANYGQGFAAAATGGYSNPYAPQTQHNTGYPGSFPPQHQQQLQQQHQPPQHQQHQQPPQHQPPQQQHQHAAPLPADVASLLGRVDNATLQRLLASMQGAAPPPPPPPGGVQQQQQLPPASGGFGHNPGAPQTANPQANIQAILGSLGAANSAYPQQAPPLPPQPGQYGSAYGDQSMAPASNGGNSGAPPTANGNASVQVQNIMAQLARYR